MPVLDKPDDLKQLAAVCRLRLDMPREGAGAQARKAWRDALLAAPSKQGDHNLRLAAIFWHDGHVSDAIDCFRRYKAELAAGLAPGSN